MKAEIIMKTLKFFSVFVVAGLLFASCDSLFEERDHRYEGPDIAEFDPLSASHVIAADAEGQQTYQANVNLISRHGNAQSDLSVNFELVESTGESDQFDLGESSVTIAQDTVSTFIPITLNVDEIDQGESFSITVQLVNGGDVDPSLNHDTFTLNVERQVEISGMIEDEDGEALDEIEVQLSGSSSAETVTSDGAYFFSVFAGGSYTITPVDPGVADENDNGNNNEENAHIANDDVLYFFEPMSLSFEDVSTPITDANFVALDPVSISGSITEEDMGPGIFTLENNNEDNPWENVTVSVYDISGDDPVAFASVTPNSDGDYAIYVKPGVDYLVEPSADHFVFDPDSVEFSDISADETADFEATPVVNLSGVITDADTGAPLEGISVELSAGFDSETVETDAEGNYLFRVSPGEDYTITPSDDNYSFSPSSVSYSDVSRDRTTNFEGEADE